MRRKGAFDHILLETTGLADPGEHVFVQLFLCLISTTSHTGPIASLFWQNEEYAMGLGHDIHLDGVVCVVDAVFGDQVRSLYIDGDIFQSDTSERQQMHEDHSDDGIGESLRYEFCRLPLIDIVDFVLILDRLHVRTLSCSTR